MESQNTFYQMLLTCSMRYEFIGS